MISTTNTTYHQGRHSSFLLFIIYLLPLLTLCTLSLLSLLNAPGLLLVESAVIKEGGVKGDLPARYELNLLPGIGQGRVHELSQFMRDPCHATRFYVVQDVKRQEELGEDNKVVVHEANTIFVEYNLDKQKHLLSKRELDLEDHNADVDDDDLLFESLLTVPSIPSENRYCIVQDDVMIDDTTLSCIVLVNQTLRIYSYPVQNPRSRTIRDIALDEMYYGPLNSRTVFVDEQYVYLTLLSTDAEGSPGNLTLYRFPNDFSYHNKSSLEVLDLKNTNTLLTNISDTHLILVCEVTEGLVIHLIEKSTSTILDSQGFRDVDLLFSDRSQEYYFGPERKRTVSFLANLNVLEDSDNQPIIIVQINVNDQEKIEYDILPISFASQTLASSPIDNDLMNYAFVLGNQLVIYGVNADHQFIYLRARINSTMAVIYERDEFTIQYKQKAPRHTPLLLLTDGNCDHFVSLMASHIRLFMNDRTRGSSYDFSVEDPTLKKARGSVIKNKTLVALYDSCLLMLSMKSQKYVHIYRLSYGNSRSFFTSITADERDTYPYVYLTYNSNKRGSTRFSIFSLETRTVIDSTSERLVNSLGGVYHNGAIYYQTTGRLVIYEPIHNNVTIIDGLDDYCFFEDNYLYSYDSATLLSVGEVLCDVDLNDAHWKDGLILEPLIVEEDEPDLTTFSFLRNRTALLLFKYSEPKRTTEIEVLHYDIPNHKPDIWWNEGKEVAKLVFKNDARLTLDYHFEGELYTLVFSLTPSISMTTLYILSKDFKQKVGSIENIPIHVQSVFLMDNNEVLLVGDRSKFILLKLTKRNDPEIRKDKQYNRSLVIGLSIGLTTVIFLPFLLVATIGLLLLFRRSKRSEKKAGDLEVKMLEMKEYANLEEVTIQRRDIKTLKRLCEGASGVVYLGYWKRAPIAIKRFKVDDEESVKKEVSILARLRHPHILGLYGVSIDDQGHYCMITPYASNGSLETLLYSNKKDTVISFQEKLRILSQMADAMTYMHEENKIIHRDLKPQNVLLDDKNDVKICDFGISKRVKSTTDSVNTSYGTREYIAPELLLRQPYDEKVDVYSFGMIMYEIFFRQKPFFDYERGGIPLSYHVSSGGRPWISFEIITRGGTEEEQATEEEYEKNRKDIIEQFLQLHPPLKKSQSRLHSIDFQEGLVRCVELYFSLVTRCWSQNPEDRPSFSTIETELEDIRQVWAQSNMEDTA